MNTNIYLLRLLTLALAAFSGVMASGVSAALAPEGIVARRSASSIAAGGNHTCAASSDETVYCWGENADGQLGDGLTSRAVPFEAEGDDGYGQRGNEVVAGLNFSCAMDYPEVDCWGSNDFGQLANSDPGIRYSSIALGVAAAISAGAYHVCALTSAGAVMCWGNNTFGELGRGSSGGFSATPAQVYGLDSGVVALSMGYNHSCALKADGSVWCWGRNADGQLGNGANGDAHEPVKAALPVKAAAIAAGAYHTCALSTQGAVYCWGSNANGELGNGALTVMSRNTPEPVGGLNAPVKLLASGSYHTCAVDAQAHTMCWGWNSAMQLGNPATTAEKVPHPVEVVGLQREPKQLAIGAEHTCAADKFGVVTCWGREIEGQLGRGVTERGPTADDVHGFAALDAVAISSGTGYHTCAVTVQGGVACWGSNSDGQIAAGTLVSYRVYTSTVPGLAAFGPVVGVTTGENHTCALHDTGSATHVSCWGQNSSGQLGDGGVSSRWQPVAVSGVGDTAMLAAGSKHSCALAASGKIQCWGSNASGQLGDGTGADSLQAVWVQGISNAVAIAAGGLHTCAVLSTGGVACWGKNGKGQLGDSTIIDRDAPVPVTGITNAIAVTAGDQFTCALLATGDVDCWGYNFYRQLGNGNTDDSLLPVPVEPLGSPAIAVEAGADHACAVLASGQVKCWGINLDGELGIGTEMLSSDPILMQSIDGQPVAAALGSNTSCVLLAAGTIDCAGDNDDGMLGLGFASAGGSEGYPMPVSYQGQSADYALPASMGPGAQTQLSGYSSAGRLLSFVTTTSNCQVTSGTVLTIDATPASGVCGIFATTAHDTGVLAPSSPLRFIRIGDGIFANGFDL
ncbi:MAG: hypothetical protein L0H70_02760 [Xanthomonadales bacterium]|nr:hypothetical protein [Xanthomonadales bacterium]